MRSSRISKDAAKLFDHQNASALTTSPPRRTTRSSLARFAYATPKSEDDSSTPDIEDAIAKKTAATATPSPARKRRKVTSAVTTSPSSNTVIKSELVEEATSNRKAPRARKPARKVHDPSTGDTAVEPPSSWAEMYKVVQEMRAPGGVAHGAAVDTMGCERLADPDASPRDQRFHTLIALMLSSQTKDTVNAVAMQRLKTELPPHKKGAPKGLNLENILAVEPQKLNEMIWAVGFHNNKTKYIKKAAEILRDEWKGDIPDTIEGLTSLPGVGPKMGYLCLSAAWDRTEGIGVDVHVHRITNLWGWHKTNNPEETRRALESWLPRDKWREINSLLVGLGQAVCLPQGRKCGDCELGLRGLCRAAERKKVLEGRRILEAKLEVLEDGSVAKREEKVTREVAIKEEVINEDE